MKSATLVLIALAVTTRVAAAQPADNDALIDQAVAKAQAAAPSIKTYAEGTLRRARRAIAVGPTVGAYGTAFIHPGDVDGALTIGVGLEMFDVPVLPEIDSVQDKIIERAKAQAKARAEQLYQGRKPDPVEVDQLAAQAYADARKEVLAVQATQPKTLEDPSFTLALEADRLLAADRWLGRLRLGVGVSKVTLGLSASFGRACRGDGCNDSVHLFAGPEVSMHILTSKEPRSNVIDGFARFDLQATGRSDGTTYDQIVLGARFLLDAI